MSFSEVCISGVWRLAQFLGLVWGNEFLARVSICFSACMRRFSLLFVPSDGPLPLATELSRWSGAQGHTCGASQQSTSQASLSQETLVAAEQKGPQAWCFPVFRSINARYGDCRTEEAVKATVWKRGGHDGSFLLAVCLPPFHKHCQIMYCSELEHEERRVLRKTYWVLKMVHAHTL